MRGLKRSIAIRASGRRWLGPLLHTGTHRPNQRRLFVSELARHWHRFARAMSPITCSTCLPHPFQDGRPHCLHVTSTHMSFLC